ncbi:MAG: DNA polymerase IV [Parvularculaceae bacterium]
MTAQINEKLTAFCRRCLKTARTDSCSCESPSIARHEELGALAIAHIDCDAFYASIEKRDDPSLTDKPLIVGGGVRGVVSTCCYIARTYGVRSAMPMFKALAACPQAVVVKPNMRKYAEAARQIRNLMATLTPLVEPLSIDEAFLDLRGTERVHGLEPARALARLQNEIRREIGVTVSIGLSCNKFLAKIASDLDKPDGFSVIGRKESKAFLARQPVRLIWGVGPAFGESLAKDGFATIGDLQKADPAALARRYGELGLRLARLANGEDARAVSPSREAKTVSAETTFNQDIGDLARLEDMLWGLCEKVARRMKADGLAGRTVTLKLKSPDFRILTRRTTLARSSNLARTLFAAAQPLLREAHEGRRWRLIGVGYSDLAPATEVQQAELFDAPDTRLAAQEAAIDRIRERFGNAAIGSGRSLRTSED